MKSFVRWLGIGAGGVAGLGLGALAVIFSVSQLRISDGYDLEEHRVRVSGDSATMAYGEHLYTIRGCADCHAEDLGGRVFIDEAPIARLAGSNLTAGEGGVAERYEAPADWERAVRHGVDPDGNALLFMPSIEFHPLSDRDLDALISYMEGAPPVDRVLPRQSLRPLGRLLFLLGEVPLLHAELIDHEAPHPDAPPAGVTASYGRYLATGCTGCHGSDMTGGPIPGAPPSWPAATNLTPDPEEGLGAWNESDFFRALREGRRPDGTAVDTIMPWQNTAEMTDQEIGAIWAYLQTLPAGAEGER